KNVGLLSMMVDCPDPESHSEVCPWPKPIPSSGVTMSPTSSFFGVRWYLRYALSYRDLEEMMNEGGLSLDRTTTYRWVPADAPELKKRIRPHLRPTNDSYPVDETYKQWGKNVAVFIVGADLRVCPGVTSYTAAGADTQVCPYDG